MTMTMITTTVWKAKIDKDDKTGCETSCFLNNLYLPKKEGNGRIFQDEIGNMGDFKFSHSHIHLHFVINQGVILINCHQVSLACPFEQMGNCDGKGECVPFF